MSISNLEYLDAKILIVGGFFLNKLFIYLFILVEKKR
jgi:hypothetical protein